MDGAVRSGEAPHAPLERALSARLAPGPGTAERGLAKESMGQRLEGKRVAFLATDGVEQVELTEPWKAVEDEGGTPELISLESGEIQGFNHLDKGDTFKVDRTVDEASEDDYDGLVLPGGVANPDFLRADEDAVRSRARSSRRASRWPPSATGRGRSSRPTWSATARSPRGRASRPTSATRAATGWTRRSVVDTGLVSSRKPDDLPAFCDKLAEEICEGRHEPTSRPRAAPR